MTGGEINAGGHGGEGRHIHQEGLGDADPQDVANLLGRGAGELGVKRPLDRSQPTQGGHGQRHGEPAVAWLQPLEQGPRESFVQAGAAGEASGKDVDGGPAGGQANVAFFSHRRGVPSSAG
jgi:hypothetical protein